MLAFASLFSVMATAFVIWLGHGQPETSRVALGTTTLAFVVSLVVMCALSRITHTTQATLLFGVVILLFAALSTGAAIKLWW
jgi:hypothetical protein